MPQVYRITVEEVLDRGNFFLKQGASNEVQDPTYHSSEHKTFICEPATNAKFDTLLTTIDSAITTAQTP